MRINHNIQALNAYSKLSKNQFATGKALEKLSSGLRINRAADDAAGLAISEKMRGQIRGLQQAEKNAMDGISLIQTAEGALAEVHDMLSRMRELAVQAANGTLTPSDRSVIQDEINQLREQIDRVGNDTQFNTKKLLNGSLSENADIRSLYGDVTYSKNGTGLKDIQVDAASVLPQGVYSMSVVTKSKVLNMDGIDDTYKTGLENFLISPDTTLEKGEYKIELTAQVGGNVGSTGLNLTSSKLEDGDYWVDSATQKVYLANAAGTGPTGSALGTTADLNLGTATADGKFTQVTTYTLTVFPKSGGAPLAQASNVKFGEAAIDFKDGTSATSTLTVDKAQFAENDILTINGKKIGFYDSASSTYTDANDAKANIGGGVDEVIDLNAVADSNALASAIAGLNLSGVTLLASGSSVTVTAATPGTSGNSITTAFAGTNPTAVTGTGTLTGGTGTGQSIGLTVDFTNALAGYVKRGGALPTTPQIPYHSFNIGELDRTSVILKDSNDKIIAHQFVDNDRKFVELKGTGISFGTGVLSNGETATNIDIRQTLQDASVTFQIGTNAGEIVALGIGDIRTKALGIDKFKLTDETSASNAIAIIDSAIDKVSAVRSKLGAYQNRMEHTVNNITQSTENLTAAESRIRDADMAKEMTEFTKLNIINQSATAMLAQANQLPQGVLQLLKG